MSRSYPIWNDITSCIYESGKSYGVRKEGIVVIRVGTSKSNSNVFLEHRVTHSIKGDYNIYRFSVDDTIVKTMWHKDKEFFTERPSDCPE